MDFFYPEYVIETYQTEKEGFQTMQKFLKLKEPPTGIYCANDITAIGMLKCLNRYSSILYRPSIISCDDIEEGQFIKPMLSTVQLPKENMARFALFVLLDRIRGEAAAAAWKTSASRSIIYNPPTVPSQSAPASPDTPAPAQAHGA